MEAVISRIKGYVLVLYPTILADLEMTDAQLNFVIAEFVDRALAYMNRQKLVVQYEADLLDPDVDEVDYELPLPKELERSLASSIVMGMRNVANSNTADTGGIKSVSDNGQTVTYTDQLTQYFSSADDASVFTGSVALMQGYILADVIETTEEF